MSPLLSPSNARVCLFQQVRLSLQDYPLSQEASRGSPWCTRHSRSLHRPRSSYGTHSVHSEQIQNLGMYFALHYLCEALKLKAFQLLYRMRKICQTCLCSQVQWEYIVQQLNMSFLFCTNLSDPVKQSKTLGEAIKTVPNYKLYPECLLASPPTPCLFGKKHLGRFQNMHKADVSGRRLYEKNFSS